MKVWTVEELSASLSAWPQDEVRKLRGVDIIITGDDKNEFGHRIFRAQSKTEVLGTFAHHPDEGVCFFALWLVDILRKVL